jgi:hypothetical protein
MFTLLSCSVYRRELGWVFSCFVTLTSVACSQEASPSQPEDSGSGANSSNNTLGSATTVPSTQATGSSTGRSSSDASSSTATTTTRDTAASHSAASSSAAETTDGEVTSSGGESSQAGVESTSDTFGASTAETGASETSSNDASSEAPLDVAAIAGDLDGYLYRGECNGGSASFECPLSNCEGGVFEHTKEVVLGGHTELVYAITLHVYGVVELRSDYHDGMRRQADKSNGQSEKDFFYEGGTYTRGEGYNVYGLRVEPALADIANADDGGNNYFLNARDNSAEGHEVWELNYDAVVRAQGGSTLTFTAYDANCLQIMNNQETARPSAGSGPNGAIVVDSVSQASPPPSNFEQPLATGGRTGQWIYIDVVNITLDTP